MARATYEATQKPKRCSSHASCRSPARWWAGRRRPTAWPARIALATPAWRRSRSRTSGWGGCRRRTQHPRGRRTARGKPYTAEERAKRVAELKKTLASIGASTDPLRQEARRLIDGGNVAGGQAKLDQALDADKKAIAEAERVAAEKRKTAAQSARDLAVLARGGDIVKAVRILPTRDAPRSDRSGDVARLRAGGTGRRPQQRGQGGIRAVGAEGGDGEQSTLPGYSATSARRSGGGTGQDLPSAHGLRGGCSGPEPAAKADPGNAGWQRDLSVLARSDRRRDGSAGQSAGGAGRLATPRTPYARRLARSDPGNAGWQRDLSVSLGTRSATCGCTGQPAGGAGQLPRRAGHRRPPGPGRPWQCRLAARPLRVAEKDRRRAGCTGQPAGGAGQPTAPPGHLRPPGQGRPWQRRLAARPLRLQNRSATCWLHRAICRRRWSASARPRHSRTSGQSRSWQCRMAARSSASPTTRLATCWWRRAICRRR